MMQQRYLKILIAAVALIGMAAGMLHAEKLQQRVSAGNNFQLGVTSGSYGPVWVRGNITMFPAGSGNLTTNYWNFGLMMAVTRDFDGDGVPEDTTMSTDGRFTTGFRAEPEQEGELAAIYASGQNVGSISGDINHMRVWTTLDDDDLADWPVGGRVDRNPSGEIIKHGAETMYTQQGDIFLGWGYGILPGFIKECSFYFLNYGESNDMVYVHENIINVTEFLKYSPNDTYQEFGAAHPNGWDWKSVCLYYQNRYFQWGKSYTPWDNLWAYHYEKDIGVTFSMHPQQPTWNPPEYPVFVQAPLKFPEYNGESMELKNFNSSGGCFGVSGSQQLGLSGKTPGQVYRNIMDTEDFLPGVINPFTGRHHNTWPGRLTPEDSRYNQWIWGGGDAWITDQCYGELHDVKPRDMFALDYVLMFVYPAIIPFVPPPLEVANIDAPIIQEALAPVEAYVNVAKIVHAGGYILPETHRPPALTIIPGDKEVSITWSDINVNTPDNYYYFLQENNLDPNGRYQEYDFEGYRVYRSFVGPNDTHSELLDDFNRSSGNLQFYYIDKLEDDYPMYRMRNGMKVWYAVVPYDKNYDVASGEMFSLPLPESAKTWNRPGEAIYSVIPRSDASEFRAASLGSPGAVYEGPAPVAASSVELAGDGTGKLTEAPQWLQPNLSNVIFTPVNNERIAQDLTIYIACTGVEVNWSGCWRAWPQRAMALLDASSNMMGEAVSLLTDDNAEMLFQSEPHSDGIDYFVKADWDSYVAGYKGKKIYRDKVYHDIDLGAYAGAVVSEMKNKCLPGNAPMIRSYIQSGVYEVTWQASGDDLTVQVVETVRGNTLNFSPYGEESYGQVWGFIIPGDVATAVNYWQEIKDGVPQAERSNLMADKVAASNTDDVALYIGGMVWGLSGVTAMPSDGTKFTITVALGEWNEDQTVFSQVSDPPWPGDKWKIEIKAMTMNPEDADISKVKVVPNPYIASSYLDLSPNNRRIEFINLPSRCTIRIYSLGGNLVNVVNHIGASRQGWGNYTDWDRLSDNQPRVFTGYDNHSGTEPWNLRNRFGQTVASGLYLYHVTDQQGQEFTGKFYVIN